MLLVLFAFVLTVPESQTARNEKVELKNQLVRSISHVNEILVEVEDKIGRERNNLLRIDNYLNKPGGPARSDIDYGINIFWNETYTQSDGSGKYGNYSYTIKTTPSLFPTPEPTSTYATPPMNWHLSTQVDTITTDTLYIQDLKKNMVIKHYGYFSSFLDEFSELIYSKNTSDANTVATLLSLLIKKNVQEGNFSSLGDNLLGGIGLMLVWFDSLTPARIQQQAGVLHHVIQVRDKALSADMNNLIDYYDSLFTKEEGQELLESLELFFVYPEANVTLKTVGEKIFNAALTPYFKSEGTRKQKRLIRLLYMAAHDIDPHFRVQTEMHYYAPGRYPTGMLKRRSINFKNNAKHLLLKHHKLLKKIKRQYKHNKNFSYKGHKHEHLLESEQMKQRANQLETVEMEDNCNKSSEYYSENPESHQQENIRNVQFTQTYYKKPLDKLKHRKMQLEPEPKHRKLLKSTITLSIVEHSKEDQTDSLYLKQFAINSLIKSQQSQNINGNRIFNILSGEEGHKNYIKNAKLHKIREASNYSDEEDRLRMNLYDALRHGNKTFVSFRKSNGDTIVKQTLRDFSSEPDEEFILKKNIYKVFE